MAAEASGVRGLDTPQAGKSERPNAADSANPANSADLH
jgi:hypothetical protein